MKRAAIEHIKNKRILFSPLNWGFGHVSRSIPILQQLMLQENSVWIACNRQQQEIYEMYFPNGNFVSHEGYPFQFKGKGNFAWDLLLSFPGLLRFSRKEKRFVKEFCKKNLMDLVVSDHRYFFRNPTLPSVFITHQLALPLPWYLKFAQKLHCSLMERFHEIWVLDTEDNLFAGKLSQGKTKNPQRFLGAVSRFDGVVFGGEKSGLVVLVSGPEPYATQFYREQKNKWRYEGNDVKFIYNGHLEYMEKRIPKNWLEMDAVLLSAEKIVSRSGYSTIMDVHFLGCKAEWFPTKGQWEQEYLAELQGQKLIGQSEQNY